MLDLSDGQKLPLSLLSPNPFSSIVMLHKGNPPPLFVLPHPQGRRV